MPTFDYQEILRLGIGISFYLLDYG